MRLWVWVAVVGGVLLLLRLFASADSGGFSTHDQSGWLAKVGLGGLAAFVLIEGFIRYRKEYRGQSDWTRYASLQPVLSLVALVGGVWLWWAYFGRHHATVLWFMVVAGVVLALRLFRDRAEKEWSDRHTEELKKMPEVPNPSGASNPDDLKGWK